MSYNDPFFLDDFHVAYTFHHKDSEVDQLYVLNIESGHHYRLTDFPVEFSNVKYNAKHRLLTFSAAVYEDGSLENVVRKDQHIKENKKDSALVYDHLMAR